MFKNKIISRQNLSKLFEVYQRQYEALDRQTTLHGNQLREKRVSDKNFKFDLLLKM